MVGFGFMDNIIMIQAGDAIDATFGVAFGFTTLTAAALGNVCSDSSGVLFGGIVERASEKLNLAKPNLSPSQLNMTVTRRAVTMGQLIGIIVGCCLGMTNLLFLDLEATERMKMSRKLDTIFEPVVKNAQAMVNAERCTLFLYDEESRELWTRISVAAPKPKFLRRMASIVPEKGAGADGEEEEATIIKLSIDATSLAATAARTKTLLNISDAKSDARHDSSWDAKTGFNTRNVLCMPILDEKGKLYGCLQAVNKQGIVVSKDGKVSEATVAIGGGLNAGLLAAQILAVQGGELAERLEAYRQQLHDTVVEKDARLKDLGSRDYLGRMT